MKRANISSTPMKYLHSTNQYLYETDQISPGHRLNISRKPIKYFYCIYQISPGHLSNITGTFTKYLLDSH